MSNLNRLFPLSIAFIFFIYICYYFYVSNTSEQSIDYDCHLENGTCLVSVMEQSHRVTFAPAPQIEEPLTLTITGPYAANIAMVHIEGVNMYMGKTPVVMEQQSDQQWQGWTMLGACTEPNMRWVLTISYRDQTQVNKIQFSTNI